MSVSHMRILNESEMQEWLRSRGIAQEEPPREKIWLPTGVARAVSTDISAEAAKALAALKGN